MKRKENKPKIHIASCSFGKDSIATILLALEHNEPLDRVVFAEVMFDHEKGISGEIPEHIDWIYNVAIPKLAEMGVKVDVVRAKKDFVSLCRRKRKSGDNAGKMYGMRSSGFCYANGELKVAPVKQYYTQFRDEYNIVQYVGIAKDEPIRLARLKDYQVSLLEKYNFTEKMAMDKCREYNLVSPCYSMGLRGGCWFCYNAELRRYINMRKNYAKEWQALRDLYNETNCKAFKYGKTLEQVEREMDIKEWEEQQPTLFDFI